MSEEMMEDGELHSSEEGMVSDKEEGELSEEEGQCDDEEDEEEEESDTSMKDNEESEKESTKRIISKRIPKRWIIEMKIKQQSRKAKRMDHNQSIRIKRFWELDQLRHSEKPLPMALLKRTLIHSKKPTPLNSAMKKSGLIQKQRTKGKFSRFGPKKEGKKKMKNADRESSDVIMK